MLPFATKQRNFNERALCFLGDWLATGHDMLGANDLAVVQLASIRPRLHVNESTSYKSLQPGVLQRLQSGSLML